MGLRDQARWPRRREQGSAWPASPNEWPRAAAISRSGRRRTAGLPSLPGYLPDDAGENVMAGPTDTEGAIRVLVADDQALVRAGFCVILDTAEGIEVVGEAADGAAAVD